MRIDPILSFKDVRPSKSLREFIQKRISRLERFYNELISCRVRVELSQRKPQGTSSNPFFHVSVDLGVPGKTLVANHDHTLQHELDTPYIAVSDAFNSIERQLKRRNQRRRFSPRKSRHNLAHASISRIFYQDGYGFIQTPENREIYFHENSILDFNFKDLRVGDEVRYFEERGDNGPQASSVHLVKSKTLVAPLEEALTG